MLILYMLSHKAVFLCEKQIFLVNEKVATSPNLMSSGGSISPLATPEPSHILFIASCLRYVYVCIIAHLHIMHALLACSTIATSNPIEFFAGSVLCFRGAVRGGMVAFIRVTRKDFYE